jgi:hypothetical protein
MFQKFYDLDQVQIVDLIRDYLSQTLFSEHSELQEVIIVAISGSIALGYYDAYSDIDLDFYCSNTDLATKHKDKIAALKLEVGADEAIPIQIHKLKDLESLEGDLSEWGKDHALRELNKSLIVSDPRAEFANLKKQFDHYPDEVIHEKIQWLFAQLVFEYEERFKMSVERGDDYFNAVSKLSIVRLVGNMLLITNNQWIAFDKHLFRTLQETGCDPNIVKLMHTVTNSTKPDDVAILLSLIEERLIADNKISKQPAKYWIDLRPRHSVDIN